MRKISFILPSLVAVIALVGILFTVLTPSFAHASAITNQIQSGVTSAGGSSSTPSLASQIKIIVNIFLYILGAIAVVMIIIGGVRYVVSAGDAGSVKGAKDTILYAVVGLVVAILAYAIVNFVVGAFGAK